MYGTPMAEVLWWAVALVAGPVISGMTISLMVAYFRERKTLPHVLAMAISYLLLLIASVVATSGVVSPIWSLLIVCLAVMIGIKGLLVIVMVRNGVPTRVAPRASDVIWVVRRFIGRA